MVILLYLVGPVILICNLDILKNIILSVLLKEGLKKVIKSIYSFFIRQLV